MPIQYGDYKLRNSRKIFIYFGLFILLLYISITFYSAYSLFENTKNLSNGKKINVFQASTVNENGSRDKQNLVQVEVWGKAAIGLYFWEHIMEGRLQRHDNELVKVGEKIINNIKFKFRTGAGIIPQNAPRGAENLVLIINGRTEEKIKFAKMWLDSLRKLPKLKNTAVILLGNEQCNNEWLLPYMVNEGGSVRIAFIVYDITNLNYNTFQWPLGVATYRKFPKINPHEIEISKYRPYKCNFLGTVYRNSSREILQKVFYENKLYLACYLRLREEWQPNESKETAEEYYHTLLNSDLTLCPVGINPECYRIYEACSMGSVPVVEDVRTRGNCSIAPLRLLKYYKAPFIYLKSWKELPGILEKEKLLTFEEKKNRRLNLLQWYEMFKKKLQHTFVAQLEKTLFSSNL